MYLNYRTKDYQTPYVDRTRSFMHWFKLWLILVIIVMIACIIITLYERPLNEFDFLNYITPRTIAVCSDASQVELDSYILTHNASGLAKLNSKQSLDLPVSCVPSTCELFR